MRCPRLDEMRGTALILALMMIRRACSSSADIIVLAQQRELSFDAEYLSTAAEPTMQLVAHMLVSVSRSATVMAATHLRYM
jgi:hypothetical protein